MSDAFSPEVPGLLPAAAAAFRRDARRCRLTPDFVLSGAFTPDFSCRLRMLDFLFISAASYCYYDIDAPLCRAIRYDAASLLPPLSSHAAFMLLSAPFYAYAMLLMSALMQRCSGHDTPCLCCYAALRSGARAAFAMLPAARCFRRRRLRLAERR